MKTIIATLAALLACTTASADWQYQDSADQMTSKRTSFARLESNNSLDLDFPYKGRNHGTLTVRQHPRYGQNVIFEIDQGQIMCSHYRGCSVIVRFDDQPPVTFSGTEPADNSPTAIFINNGGRFISAASKARKILVQVGLFHNGSQVLEFHSAKPLDWKPKK